MNKDLKVKLENKLYADILELERFKTYAEQLINKIHKEHCVLRPQSEIAIKEYGLRYGGILSIVAYYLEQYEIQQNQHKEVDNGKA
jgi:hypothetical protein